MAKIKKIEIGVEMVAREVHNTGEGEMRVKREIWIKTEKC